MTLEKPLTVIKGIGKEMATDFANLGIRTVKELFDYFPYRYEDHRLREVEELKHGEYATLEGNVHSLPVVKYYGGKKSKLSVRVLVGRHLITVVLFNRPFLKKQLKLNQTVTVYGRWDQRRMTLTASKIEFSSFSPLQAIEPVYSLKGKMYPKQFRRFLYDAFKCFGNDIEETLPSCLRTKYKLISKKEALEAIHFPLSYEQLKQARRRLVYEELLLFQLKMQAFRKFEREKSKGTAKEIDQCAIDRIVAELPFALTEAQNRVLSEILDDLRSPFRMNRLLQGDVGSGKTVIAAIALFAVVKAGFQGAFMVPTEILAEQHSESLNTLLGAKGVSASLLTSSVKGKKREPVLAGLKDGSIDIVIGTHSLIQDDVVFRNLGLVVTDEQHRFGVEQRRMLKKKGWHPDVLFMTATPIPRTLAITAFGDMDVSTIDQLPQGRKPVETYWVKNKMLKRVFDFLYKEVQKGRQAYVICPLIEDSDKLDVQNAIDVYAKLKTYYPDLAIGLMHGRLSNDEKEQVMQAFSQNDIQILVSTTVVEVGVNVPDASLMVIYDAERFGLAQLHQLRGRVGRGDAQAYCFLVADPKTPIGKERMKTVVEMQDGFAIAEQDLRLRGPGDVLGLRQSGEIDFRLVDLSHDHKMVECARMDARKVVEQESFLINDGSPLQQQLLRRGYGEVAPFD